MQHDDPVIRDLMHKAFRHYVGLPDVPDAVQLNHDDYAPYVSEAELEEDLVRSESLFDILEEHDNGTISPARVKPGSPAEREARAAASRLLLAGSSKDCGKACQSVLRRFYAELAYLIAPGASQFELVLRRREGKKGPATSDTLTTSIAHSLARQIQTDECVEAAINDAARRYAVSERTVWNVWEEEGRYILDTWNFIKRGG